jgi:ribosome-associated heat shock protein Hsp15
VTGPRGSQDGAHDQAQRLDRWLWAARFFKTRSAASTAINGGKVSVDGVKPKPARRIRLGAMLRIERDLSSFEVEVTALNERRGPATEAREMYRETEASVARRNDEQVQARRRAQRRQQALGRPQRDDRRAIARLKGHAPDD